MKSSGSAADRDLSEDSAPQSQFLLDQKMKHIVRHQRVETGRGVHRQIRLTVAHDNYRVTPFACSVKFDFHIDSLEEFW